jgi:hypothetical protein
MLITKPTTRWAPLLAVAVAALILVTGQPASAAVNRTYSYEYGLSGWQVGYEGYGTWAMSRSTEQAYNGRYSIGCYLDGTAGPGTAWLAHQYAAPIDTLMDATLTFRLWSSTRSDVNQWEVLAYVGTRPPAGRADFQVIGYTNGVAGWQEFTFQRLQLTGQWPASVWVAYGISSTWEYAQEYYMDYVTVTLRP